MTAPKTKPAKQLLHMVFGGELNDVKSIDFKDLSKLDVVGFFPNYAEAHKAWQGKARETIDNAQMRYFIAHMHRLLDPSVGTAKKPPVRKKV